MKKYVLVIVLVVLILVGLRQVYLKRNTVVKSTKDTVAELFGKKYNRSLNTFTISVSVDTGMFAKGTFNETGGGGVWFAAKTANGWELAAAGNGIVPCEEINKYNFPKDIIPQCIEVKNENKLIQR